MMNFPQRFAVRRRITIAVMALATLAGAGPVAAQDFPSHPLKLVVPFLAGGTADTLARMIAQGMGEQLGQTVVVDNRTGAGGTIGATSVARSTPDGYTLLLGSGSTHTTPQVVMKTMPYNPVEDFEPIAMIGTTSYVLMVNPKLSIRTLQELIAYGKANPGKLTYGSTGAGAAVHLAIVNLERITGASFQHIPYRGGSQILVDLMGGQIDFSLGTAESAAAVSAGKLRALAILGLNRLSAMPDVPSCIESGLPNCSFPVWNAVFAPAGTARPVMAKLTAAVEHTLAQPQTQKRLRELGYEPGKGGPAALTQRIVEESKLIRETAAAAGVHPE